MTDDEWEEDGCACPVCKKEVIVVTGPKSSRILLVGGEPTPSEIADGQSFVGPSAHIFRQELAFVGVDLRSCRRMVLWQHLPDKGKGNSNEKCFQYFLQEVIKETVGKGLVILVGALPVKVFCDESISAVSGLLISSKYFSVPAIGCIAPGNVFSGGVGEMRFFTHQLKKAIVDLELDKVTKKSTQIIHEEIEDW